MDKSWTVHQSRALTQALQQPAQETNSLSTINNSGSQPGTGQTCRKPYCSLSWQSKMLNNNSHNNPLQKVRT